MKSYSELISIPSFVERYRYLRIGGSIGEETFGCDRWLNQVFYKDPEWRSVRNEIIIRDGACDLAMPGFDIRARILVHHINPITKADVINRSSCLFDPENLVCTSDNTHNAIHYGDESMLVIVTPIIRAANDTCPWKR